MSYIVCAGVFNVRTFVLLLRQHRAKIQVQLSASANKRSGALLAEYYYALHCLCVTCARVLIARTRVLACVKSMLLYEFLYVVCVFVRRVCA